MPLSGREEAPFPSRAKPWSDDRRRFPQTARGICEERDAGSSFIHEDLESGIGIVSVFCDIQSFAFLIFADTQTDGLFYDREGQQAQDKRPRTVRNDPEQLNAQ